MEPGSPGSRQFVGLNNYIAVVKDSQFWSVAVNTVILIVGVVLISALLGLLIACCWIARSSAAGWCARC